MTRTSVGVAATAGAAPRVAKSSARSATARREDLGLATARYPITREEECQAGGGRHQPGPPACDTGPGRRLYTGWMNPRAETGQPALTPLRAGLIVAAALAAGAGVAVLELTSDHQDAQLVWAVFGPVVGWSFVGTGLFAWQRRPANRTGALMVLLGFFWFLFTIDASDSSLVYTFAQLTGALWGGVF